MAITNLYQDKIMGGVRGDPNPFGYQNQINDFVLIMKIIKKYQDLILEMLQQV